AIRIENLHFSRHDLHQQHLQSKPHGALFFVVIPVPVDHLMVEALAATAHQIAVHSGAQADTRGFDTLVGHNERHGYWRTGWHLSPLSKADHPYISGAFGLTLSKLS